MMSRLGWFKGIAIVALIVGLLSLAGSALAQTGTCSVTVTVDIINNVPEARTARIRIFDTDGRGRITRIVASVEQAFARNERRTLTLTSDVLPTYFILINRAGMRLISEDLVFTGDPAVCDSVQSLVSDGRINAGLNQQAAPLAAYCQGAGNIDVYDIDARGEGTRAFRATAVAIADALTAARTTGLNQLVAEGSSDQLYALTSGEIQFNGLTDDGKLYEFIAPGDTCVVR